jgi:hypothetical protein
MTSQNPKPRNYNWVCNHTHTHTHKLEQGFLKPKLHISKEKRITVNFLIPSWVFPLLANLLLISDKTSSYLEATYLLFFLPSLITSLPILNHNNIFLILTSKEYIFYLVQISPTSPHLFPLFYLYFVRPKLVPLYLHPPSPLIGIVPTILHWIVTIFNKHCLLPPLPSLA